MEIDRITKIRTPGISVFFFINWNKRLILREIPANLTRKNESMINILISNS